jgi:hypothetical protein
MSLKRVILGCGVACALVWAVPTHAYDDYQNDPFDPTVARDAWILISRAEAAYNIPPGLLHAISLVETGKGIRGWVLPWPYTIGVNGTGSKTVLGGTRARDQLATWRAVGFVRFDIRAPGVARYNVPASQASALLASVSENAPVVMEGRNYGRRFNTSVEAETFARRMFALGYTNLDIGMMQINWRVHGQHFASVSDALEPRRNLQYAVRYLLENRQTRDWWRSVGRYHSGTPVYANKYIKNVYAMYLRIHRVKTTA